ncbi:polysaccharide lyase [Polaribacter sp. L3A8]|uniref:polysaccharide lyase n=1 Tax=Polaribacter sp. L3A8 TaxID=2686361 RepID=UPI00131EA3DB|nr:Ig-like domain-containing protein [Polaribacter sp. L3A8]
MKQKISIAVITIGLLLFTVTNANAQTVDVYQNNLNDLTTGLYNQDQIKEALAVSFCKGADEGRVSIVSLENQGNSLKVNYPKGKVKTGESGIHTKVYFNDGKEHDELYFSYKIYFPSDFEFRAGGKLPGLSYQTREKNMSLRLMWRNNGLIETYVHYNTKPTRPGYKASINWSLLDPIIEPNNAPQEDQVKFTKGTWQHVEMYYKLNTPGKKDGIMKGWLNGKLALNITNAEDYRQVGEEDIHINSFYLSSFFGGSDETFQPTKDVYAYFDDFKVATTRIGMPSDTENNNQSPTVSITSPTSTTPVNAGSNLQISALANDADGVISKVEFYSGAAKLGEDSSFPFKYTLSNIAAGTYTFNVVAIDDKGASTKSSTVQVTVDSDGNATSDCKFNTPRVNTLPAYDNITFNTIYVLGSGGPDSSNIKKIRIKWIPGANGLYVFSMNTNNGQPSSYIDLRNVSTANFNNAQPDITISGSGVARLDDDYWVTEDAGNLVLVSKSGTHTIYCSNSNIAPSCIALNKEATFSKSTLEETSAAEIKIYPNPVEDGILHLTNISADVSKILIYDILGNLVKTLSPSTPKKTYKLYISNLKKGTYILVIESKSNRITKRIIKI